MRTRTRKRRFILALFWGGAAVFLLVVAWPVWFPWILRPVLARAGVRYATYQRKGYGRFGLAGLEYQNDSIHFQAKRFEAFLPTTWVFHHLTSGRLEPSFVRLEDWSLQISPKRSPTPQSKAPGTNSLYTVLKDLEQELPRIRGWLPNASALRGTVIVNTNRIALSSVVWTNGEVTAQVAAPGLVPPTRLQCVLAGAPKYRFRFETSGWGLKGDLRWARTDTEVRSQAELDWGTNRVQLSAQFGQRDWIPSEAKLSAGAFRVPLQRVGLPYPVTVEGGLSAAWHAGRYQARVQANVSREQGASLPIPQNQTVVAVSGDPTGMKVDTLHIALPFLKVHLLQPAEVGWKIPFLKRPATVAFQADLSHQSWMKAQGRLTGELKALPMAGSLPETSLQVDGAGVRVGDLAVEPVHLAARLAGNGLDLNSLELGLHGGPVLRAQGRADLAKRRITDATFQVHGPLKGSWLPRGFSADALSWTGQVAGAWAALDHRSRLRLNQLEAPGLKPLNLSLQWMGRAAHVSEFGASATAPGGELTLRGGFDWKSDRAEFSLSRLDLVENNTVRLALEHPCRLSLDRAPGPGGVGWRIHLGELRWKGTNARCAIQGTGRWPAQGDFHCVLQDFPVQWLQPFTARKLPDLRLQHLQTSVQWDNGPARLALDAKAALALKGEPSFSAALQMGSGPKGTHLDRLVLSDSKGGPIVTGKGELPVLLQPAAQAVKWLPQQPIHLAMETRSNPSFWKWLAKLTGVRLENPELNFSLQGSLKTLQGVLRAETATIDLTRWKQKLPRLSNLHLALEVSPDQLNLRSFRVNVEGQPILLKAALPLGPGWVSGLTSGKRELDWKQVRGELQIPAAHLAAFKSFLPPWLAPNGTLKLNASVQTGGHLRGTLSLRGAATRPLLPFGTVQGIQADVSLTDNQLRLKKLTGALGGSPLTLTGRVDLPAWPWPQGRLPPFQFHLTGTNVPLAREPDFIVRSDLDVTVGSRAGKPPQVTGTIHPRDSFFLADLKLLLPGGVATPSKRPPYFSVDVPPVSGWDLNLDLRGTRFLKVNTPLFQGEISAQLKLHGTPKEPQLLGEVTIASGSVLFPFATLQVHQGLISFNSDNPYRPQLFILAQSRTFGYDITMEVKGPADDPAVTFTSNPILSPEQIVLMLTAGELPKNELTFTNQQKASRLAFFLGKNLLSTLGLPSGGENRLTVRSGEDISEQGKETYYVEYRLTDNWAIVAEYDRFNALNAGVKWRIYSR